MKFRFLWVGKTRSAPEKEMIRDYLDRVSHHARVEVVELRDREAGKETEEILGRIESDSFVVVMDERGQEMSSSEFAQMIDKHRNSGTRRITFVAGGHAGVSTAVRERADLVLALSRMTLTHELARVLLIEQVYRAFAIIGDLPYHK